MQMCRLGGVYEKAGRGRTCENVVLWFDSRPPGPGMLPVMGETPQYTAGQNFFRIDLNYCFS
ncbi:hypothetical protein BKD03_02680 [Brucella sp. 09RB8471]|nr:hypothetical protein BKD03_02680 [Brucella sp. 09RB8471]